MIVIYCHNSMTASVILIISVIIINKEKALFYMWNLVQNCVMLYYQDLLLVDHASKSSSFEKLTTFV